ncbi:MAG: DUF6629 family protein [Bdellovibrionales bacterium]
MCFSPVASFAAGSALVLIGAASVHAAPRRAVALALVPVLFGIQQFIEGLIWLRLLEDPDALLFWLPRLYAVFAGIIWPVLVPAAILNLEQPGGRRTALVVLLGAGIGVALYAAYALVVEGVVASIANQCILYVSPDPVAGTPLFVYTYALAACGGFFFSRHRCLLVLGFVNLGAFLYAYHMYAQNFSSVWCFFAALVSMLIYFCIRHIRTSPR